MGSGDGPQRRHRQPRYFRALFEKAMETPAKYEADDLGLTPHAVYGNIDPDLMTGSLREKMHQMARKRQNRPLSKTINFALYKEKHLKILIEEITTLTNKLSTLLP